MRFILPVFVLLLAVPQPGMAQQPIDFPTGVPGTLRSERQNVANENGETTEVEAGTFLVPESRSKPSGKVIEIPFYRLKSTSKSPGPPIFLLAGGPGSSWINNFRYHENFKEVKFYQSMADVVLFDQRGCGRSRPALKSHERKQFPLLKPLDPESVADEFRRMSKACRERLIQAGVDVTAYNTQENAADVNELRTALGYKKISLVGGSYGSHLALSIMRSYPETVSKVILFGVEGPDHTWDDPDAYLSTLRRIANAAEASEELGPHIPEGGLLNALQTVIDRLEKEPVRVTFQRGGESITVLVDAFLVRKLAGFQAGRKSRLNFWPELIIDLYHGDYSQIARGAHAMRMLRLNDPVHYMMDCSSGISEARRARYDRSAAKSLLGNVNLEYACLSDIWKMPDMGESFRADFESKIPTLIIHGTWDTSTPIENAREVASMLGNAHLVEVVTGNHGALYNLYEHWDPAREMIGAFLKGETVKFPKQVQLTDGKFRPRMDDGAND